MVDELAWVKRTVNGKIAKGHGFYLQHAKESCLVGVKVFIKFMFRVPMLLNNITKMLKVIFYGVKEEDKVKNQRKYMT